MSARLSLPSSPTSRYLAEDAIELIEIDYEPLGAVARAELAVADNAPLLHEEAGGNVLIAREFQEGRCCC